jgi:hypothetical protein
MKERLRIDRTLSGVTVTCTLTSGDHTSRWVARGDSASIAYCVREARAGAKRGLDALTEVLAEEVAA